MPDLPSDEFPPVTPEAISAAFAGEDDFFMNQALREAHKAGRAGEVPIGCVIVQNGHVIARSHNQVELLTDATAHAEMLAITQAESALGDWRLADCTLYVTKEPCPMCAGAIVLSRLARVVYGAPDAKAGAGGGWINLLQAPQLNHRCEVTTGVLQNSCAGLLVEFFRARRAENNARKEGAEPGASGGFMGGNPYSPISYVWPENED